MAKFLEYVPGESFLHRMNPCVKLVGAVQEFTDPKTQQEYLYFPIRAL